MAPGNVSVCYPEGMPGKEKENSYLNSSVLSAHVIFDNSNFRKAGVSIFLQCDFSVDCSEVNSHGEVYQRSFGHIEHIPVMFTSDLITWTCTESHICFH